METRMARHEGGCLCGEVRFVVDKEPMRVTVCHCHFCQRTTGTAYLVEPVFAEADFHMTAGTPKTYDVISAGSGKRVTIHFCGTCGARVMLGFERFPGFEAEHHPGATRAAKVDGHALAASRGDHVIGLGRPRGHVKVGFGEHRLDQ